MAEVAREFVHLVRTGARDDIVLPYERSASGNPVRVPRLLWPAASVAIIALAAVGVWLFWPAPKWEVEICGG